LYKTYAAIAKFEERENSKRGERRFLLLMILIFSTIFAMLFANEMAALYRAKRRSIIDVK